YFADGMTEELISKLARISALRVISRTSVMEYKGTHKKSLPQIAEELNVDAIVEGSVMQSESRVRITAQLIHGPTDKHLWTESYERDLKDILALQNEVASTVAQEIRIKLTPQEKAQFTSTSKVNPTAYEAYLRGISYTRRVRVTDEEMQLGKTMLERAIEIDPNFVKAYAELSRAYSRVYFIDHTAESLIKAKKYVDRALQIQPGLPEGHIALGFYYYYGFRNYEQALHEFSIAQKTVPNNPDLLVGFAAIQKRQGNLRAALQENKRILELEPRSAATATELGILSVMIGEQANAQRYFDLAISLQPDNSGPYQYKVDAYLKWTGDTKGARSLITKIPDDEGRKEYLQWIEMMDRNYQAALDFLPLGTNTTYENAILAGDCYRLMHKMTKARASYDAARVELEKLLEKDSKNEDLHAAISMLMPD
ncbi:hypothetical protein L0244_26820, partial [bacterium]|nr:hypothetical protein [bacterium]